MILNLPLGATEFPVPDRLQKLIPPDLSVEAVKLADGTETIALSIIKIRSVTCKLLDVDFTLSDEELKSRIIEPMLYNLK